MTTTKMITTMTMMTMTMMTMTIIAIASSSHWNVLAAGRESWPVHARLGGPTSLFPPSTSPHRHHMHLDHHHIHHHDHLLAGRFSYIFVVVGSVLIILIITCGQYSSVSTSFERPASGPERQIFADLLEVFPVPERSISTPDRRCSSSNICAS